MNKKQLSWCPPWCYGNDLNLGCNIFLFEIFLGLKRLRDNNFAVDVESNASMSCVVVIRSYEELI